MILKSRQLHLYRILNKEKYYRAKKLIGYSDEQMYSVVADIKHYKQFLPFCTKSTILDTKGNILHANLEIGFPPVVENYTSKVTLVQPRMVKAQCNDGRLFNYLETTWKFAPGLPSNSNSCIIDFYVKFEFKSMLHSQLATMFFDRVVKQMEFAFVDEVRRRYGKESIESHMLKSEVS
ncbi:coenzyme Q-binding protein COQ10 homolog B, mitochondrial [Anthonomus grandis grandis]|uniref:coenzyme Q-binding protein COQ10 homolog B, mitochondrial n=1 Tax=Anthonomus grandis grandis TaxID=2921223 RepID=UPI0021651C73|nr:coenzyme Q-binding protein COQ10 homolog B, mitochondrial [Anthonomus grandis grandis]